MRMNLKSKKVGIDKPWVYFAITFAWTWLFWSIAIVTGVSMELAGGLILLLLGVIAPMVTGITFTALTQDREGRRDYWKRVTDFRRIGWKWGLVIVLFTPVLNVLAALLDMLLGGDGMTWGPSLANFASDPTGLFFSAIFASLIPFIEELGWRGYALDRLQSKHNALVSSLILNVLWSLWHLPMFFIPGSYQAGLGIGTLEFWLFFIAIIPLGFVMTWVYNNTKRSILAAILFHAMVNFTGELIAITPRADTIAMILWIFAAIAIVLIWGSETFVHRKEQIVTT